MNINSKSIPFCSGDIYYWEKFLPPNENHFDLINEEIPWRQDSIRVMGKVYPTPRLHAWIANPDIQYSYSGTQLHNERWTPRLLELKSMCEDASGSKYNSLLANFYRSGKDSNGWHADNEKELGENPTIAMVSIGEVRRFSIRDNQNFKNKLDFDLPSGSLLVMKGLQNCSQHCLRKTAKICAPRISLTFRLTHSLGST
jgi:alkylated DNA repair dioxygenase AlkB